MAIHPSNGLVDITFIEFFAGSRILQLNVFEIKCIWSYRRYQHGDFADSTLYIAGPSGFNIYQVEHSVNNKRFSTPFFDTSLFSYCSRWFNVLFRLKRVERFNDFFGVLCPH